MTEIQLSKTEYQVKFKKIGGQWSQWYKLTAKDYDELQHCILVWS